MHKHILICGDIGCGKSTLVHKLLSISNKSIAGFITKSYYEPSADGAHHIFIYPYGNENDKRKVADCFSKRIDAYPEIFDSFALDEIDKYPDAKLIVMDELGFLEKNALIFQQKILELFNGSTTIIAVVKSKNQDSTFLNSIKNHPNADMYYIDINNRDALFKKLKNDPRLKK